jgi:alanyl-tRNA synthetase
MPNYLTGNQIRKEFIDFFVQKGHKFVPSASLVPGGDQTLLFTNAGMVQFKDVFLGTDKRPYKRAVNSQKCMRVAGKHNDLDDVGRDDYHHTFFEMLGNWSFGDYYKKEAIAWAWELLTKVWGLDKSRLWVTYFKDEKGEVATDEEAASSWKIQPGIIAGQILPFGRKDNFWEMADTGPCGPCSEIHYDRGEEFCDKKDDPKHVCGVNGDCHRFLELWNLVFIQYNRINPTQLDPLPATHVDTGMGFERIVSVMQQVDSNYRTDLLLPLIQVVQGLTGHSDAERDKNFTPYRVIADHARAATFLIADGVVPGNIGRNYICRMIIRRAARFGSKLGLTEPFMAKVAGKVIEIYGEAYPELVKNKDTILDNLTREEQRFQSTVESGLAHLEDEIQNITDGTLSGATAFDLYATHGLPLEITRDVLRERGLEVDQEGFFAAMEEHRIHSGAGKEFGPLGGENAEFYSQILETLQKSEKLGEKGVLYDPYFSPETETKVVAIIKNGALADQAAAGEEAEIITEKTGFYIESGGQVSDQGIITAAGREGQFTVEDMQKPAAGMIIHIGKVTSGTIKVGDAVQAKVDRRRRQDIKRNHTATHLLQAELRKVLGEHVRQAGSMVAPDRLRFDFTHPQALTQKEWAAVEEGINQRILDNYPLKKTQKKLAQALEEGATALFGEKYGEDVRTIQIGDEEPLSYELCGGTHVDETGEIGTFIILSEGSAAAGIRRIEAATGRAAYQYIQRYLKELKQTARILECGPDETGQAVQRLINKNEANQKILAEFKKDSAKQAYHAAKAQVKSVDGMSVMTLIVRDSNVESLRELADIFRQEYTDGVAVFANVTEEGSVQLITTVSDMLVKRGKHAGNLAKSIASEIGGSGGGRPQLAQAGGNDAEKLKMILEKIESYIKPT